MLKLKIRQGDWVIVCDGKKALVLENAGDEKFLNLKTREVFEHPDLKTSELGTGAPGRSFSSVGSDAARSSSPIFMSRRNTSSCTSCSPSRRRNQRRQDEIADHGRPAARARRVASGLFHNLRAALRARSTRISSGFPCTRSRSISGGEAAGSRRPCRLLQELADIAGQDRLAVLAERAQLLDEIATAARSRISCG